MKNYIFALAATAAMLASCSLDEVFEKADNGTSAPAITTISVSSGNSTRAVLNEGVIKWETGDKLGVFGPNASHEAKNVAYTLTSGSGSTSGEFCSMKSDITSISALMYPYQENASFASEKLTFEIPTVQKGVKGSFDKNAAIMYAIGSSANQQLSFAVNFLKVTIPGASRVRSITISSPSTTLTGKMELTGGNVSTVADEGCNYVKLTADPGQTLSVGDYYIAVKPGEIVTPTIRYVVEDELFGSKILIEKSKTSSNNIQFTTRITPISVDFNTGDVTTREAYQIWSGGPYFAKFNVGVTDGKRESYGGNYAWGGCQDGVSDSWTGEGMLTGEHDTATKLWGPNWRMPTADEFQSLIDNCNVEGTKENGVKGFMFTNKAESGYANLFLPTNKAFVGVGEPDKCAYFWSSTPAGGNNVKYLFIYFYDFDGDIDSEYNKIEVREIPYLTTNVLGSVRAVMAE